MIAYFILVHRYPHQFKRLFKAIYSSKNFYLIHIDKKADIALHTDISQFLGKFKNAAILESQNVLWGGYSMVSVELRGMQELLTRNLQWEFFINLSGQDFPLQSQTEIHHFLRANAGKSFLRIQDQRKERPNTLNRINNSFVESETGFLGKPVRRKFLADTIPYIGGQWKILSRSCCEFICSSPKVAKFRKFYRHTLIADESFFQTVLMNTNYSGELINDDKRAIIWVPDPAMLFGSKKYSLQTTNALVASGKIKLRPKTLTCVDAPFLLGSSALFARKFDETIDATIFNLLQAEKTIQLLIEHPNNRTNLQLVAVQPRYAEMISA